MKLDQYNQYLFSTVDTDGTLALGHQYPQCWEPMCFQLFMVKHIIHSEVEKVSMIKSYSNSFTSEVITNNSALIFITDELAWVRNGNSNEIEFKIVFISCVRG